MLGTQLLKLCQPSPPFCAVLAKTIEPISKLFEKHGDAGELHKTEEGGGIILPADEEPPLPLQPGKEAFDEPAPLVPS